MMPEAGIAPQATVMFDGAIITGSAAGITVMILLPVMVLLHASVYDQVSVSVPPQLLTAPVLVAVTLPEIRHEAEFE